MQSELSHFQSERDRAAREFLALAAWGFNRESVRDAVSRLTSGPSQPTSALAWLIEHVAKLPSTEEPAGRLHQLVEADSAVRAYRANLEAAQEALTFSLTPGFRCA